MAKGKRFRPQDVGIAILRVAVGLTFALVHGIPKLLGGPDYWHEIGTMPGDMGTRIAPTSFGFLAAMIETVGGTLLVMGYHTRIAASLVLTVPLVACLTLLHLGSPDWHYPALTCMSVLALAFTGGGKYSKDTKVYFEQVLLKRAIMAQAVARARAHETQRADSEPDRLPSGSTPEAPQPPLHAPPTVQVAR